MYGCTGGGFNPRTVIGVQKGVRSRATRFLEEIKGGSVGVFELAQTGRSRHTHQTQVSLYEAHGITGLVDGRLSTKQAWYRGTSLTKKRTPPTPLP